MIKPVCTVMVGLPACGKSTLVNRIIRDMGDHGDGVFVYSTDNLLEAWAADDGKTYNEVFKDYMPIAVRLMANQAEICRANGVDVIWDQTSTTIASRARKFNMLPDYEHIAVVFRTPEHKELVRRLSSRWESGKIVPEHVVASMIASWEDPTEEEGFTEIWYAG